MPGVAELPLHDGRVPGWMLKLMERMSEAIVDAIVELHGPEALVRGLSDPSGSRLSTTSLGWIGIVVVVRQSS